MAANDPAWNAVRLLRSGRSGVFGGGFGGGVGAPPVVTSPIRRGISKILIPDDVSPTEKFNDPLYACMGKDGYTITWTKDDQDYWHAPSALGYEYLSASARRPSARIAAMRNKIATAPPPVPVNVLVPVRDESQKALRNYALKLLEAYKTDKGRQELAKAVDAPLAAVEAEGKRYIEIASTKGGNAGVFIGSLLTNAGAQFRPLIRQAVSSLAGEIGSSVSTTANTLGASIASSVPVILAVVTAMLNTWAELEREKNDRFATACREFLVSQVEKPYRDTLEAQLPPPWQAIGQFSLSCRPTSSVSVGYGSVPAAESWRVTDDQQAVANAYQDNLKYLLALPFTDQRNIVKWWTLASSLMGDPKVFDVFSALGKDVFGGTLASDEQVMLVAAPIAVANGLDIDSFAQLLWNKSGGWKSHPELSKIAINRKPFTKIKYDCSGGFFASGCDISAIEYQCETTPGNARQIQWAVLVKDAFNLIDSGEAFKAGVMPASDIRSGAGFIPARGVGEKRAGNTAVAVLAAGLGAAFLLLRGR